ncbi:hypothetical protein SAMN06265222_101110 [Neorhodopirellula lusitana]|uniref:Uncharacterized protein n=1 Tax=Neorhodopirellula lusitana TaxID=445327 RepID=A0ABY1PPC1_9BACT|nr:hypothetical protein SAMN06265222_101110 [Neorhodopirellula lusitana]
MPERHVAKLPADLNDRRQLLSDRFEAVLLTRVLASRLAMGIGHGDWPATANLS